MKNVHWDIVTVVMLAAILLMALSMTGCATVPSNTTINQFTRQDVQAALSIAESANDTRAVNCFTALLAELPETTPPSPDQPVGLVSTYETVRAARISLKVGVSDAVISACAPMVIDSQNSLLHAFLLVH